MLEKSAYDDCFSLVSTKKKKISILLTYRNPTIEKSTQFPFLRLTIAIAVTPFYRTTNTAMPIENAIVKTANYLRPLLHNSNSFSHMHTSIPIEEERRLNVARIIDRTPNLH